MASTSSTAAAASAAAHGRRCTARLQRAAGVVSGSRGGRAVPGIRSRSILRPAKPSSAGSSVTDAAIVTSTAKLADSATPCR